MTYFNEFGEHDLVGEFLPVGGGGIDSDAQAFITAASITDSTQQSAIITLVTSLKSANIWTKMKAIYPFVGGTASSHKFNLKDPRDLDAAYRLVFNGGWTHSSTGALPNGSNAYADTKFIPSTNGITTSNVHISFYSRDTSVYGLYPIDMGVDQPGTGLNLSQKMSSFDSLSYHGRAFAQRIDGVDTNNIAGLHILSRTSTLSLKYIRNNSIIQTNTTLETGPVPTLSIFISSLNNNGTPSLFSSRQQAFTSIGDGLTDAEATAFYNAVQAYQTTLNRQV